ncbi:MAG: hypothetical protein GF364_08345 [Candidatus Lokiarchaeota archaeon]|nr:hypothetical protein [Candidatus Lokiarchaeota archaeon]
MQAPTHFLMGILIYKIFENLITPLNICWNILLVYPLIILSHFLIDAIAKITYHVPDARPQDKFWLGYHIFILGLTLFFIFWFWNPFILAMFFSVLVDIIDWGILRAIRKREPIIHPIIDKFRNSLFSWLPELIEKKWTVINEFTIISILLILIYIL